MISNFIFYVILICEYWGRWNDCILRKLTLWHHMIFYSVYFKTIWSMAYGLVWSGLLDLHLYHFIKVEHEMKHAQFTFFDVSYVTSWCATILEFVGFVTLLLLIAHWRTSCWYFRFTIEWKTIRFRRLLKHTIKMVT